MRSKTKIVSAFIILTIACTTGWTQPVAASGNDYPAYLKSAYMDSGYDPWRFLNRECTSFVAWRMVHTDGFAAFSNYLHGPKGNVWLGNASTWGSAAARAGYAVNDSPANGAVLWIPGSYYNPWGHVAYVSHVNMVPKSVKVANKVYYYKQVGDYGGNPIFGRFFNIVYTTNIVQVPVSVSIEEYNRYWTGTYSTRTLPMTGYHYIHFKDLK